MRSIFLCLFLLLFGLSITVPVDAQESTAVSGVVTSFRSIPLNHVTVKSIKAGHIVQTDSLGRFLVQCLIKDRLIISASGFDSKRQRIKKNTDPLKIDLVYSNEETSFDLATKNNHLSGEVLQGAIDTQPMKGQKDYSMYSNIYELIDNEIHNVIVNGGSVTTTKIQSIEMSSHVLFVVDEVMVGDISGISPLNVKSIRFVDGVGASMYGSKGANGIIEITLKN